MKKRVLLMLLVAGVLLGNRDVSAMDREEQGRPGFGIGAWFRKKIDQAKVDLAQYCVKSQYREFLHADRYACSDWKLADVLDNAYQLGVLGDLLLERDRDGNTLLMRCVIADSDCGWGSCRRGLVKMIINAAKSVNCLNALLCCVDHRGRTVLNCALYAECSGIFCDILKEAQEAHGSTRLLSCSMSIDPRDRMHFLNFATVEWRPFFESVDKIVFRRDRDYVIKYAESMRADLRRLPVA